MQDTGVLENYYKTNFQDLCKNLHRTFPTTQDAEDTVQEAFTRALTYWKSFDSTRPFEGWFRRILQNCIREKLSDIRNGGLVKDVVEEETYDALEDEDVVAMVKDRIKSYVGHKDASTKETLELHFLKGYMPMDIQKITGINKRTISQTLFRFKRSIKNGDEGI